jgi:hypothetical protein
MTETKRGRPTLPEGERRQQIGVRTSPALKADLERAAGDNGRSVAQEAELRLVDSFEAERRSGSPETAQLMRMLADQIAVIERTTGKRWHKDLTTWAAVAEAAAKGPVQQLRPDRTTDDELANEAWDALWAIIMEKQQYIETLRGAGLHVPRRPQPARAGATDALGSYIDLNRTSLRRAIDALSISEDDRDKLREAIAGIIVLDEAETKAESHFLESVRPYLEAEARGRELFAAKITEKETRSAIMSAAREGA